MKYPVLFAAFLFLLIGNVHAQSQLKIRLADNGRFNVSVNGRYFDRRGTSVTVGDLPPGRHKVKIYRMVYDRWGRSFNNLIYTGWVNTDYKMVTYLTYDPYIRAARIREVPFGNAPERGTPGEAGSRYNEGYPEPEPDVKSSVAAADKPAEKPQNDVAASPVPTGSLTDEKAKAIKDKVAGKKTDTEKFNLIRSELAGATFSTIQVCVFMDCFLFESTKVDFAKWAYKNTADKEFFSDVVGKLSLKESKDEMNRFLKK